MFGQTFDFSDIPRIGVLTFLEILLSADNAIVLGVLTAALPPHLRTKALYIGAISAFFFRALALLSISVLLQYQWIQILGALYLLYLSWRHFKGKKKKIPTLTGHHFWKTVFLIEFFDLAFAFDSIFAGVAFIAVSPSEATFHPKLWIVYVGGMLGLLGIRYAAHLFSLMIHRFPRLETSAHLMIGWIGLKLAYTSFPHFPSLEPFFWGGVVLLFFVGLIKKQAGHHG